MTRIQWPDHPRVALILVWLLLAFSTFSIAGTNICGVLLHGWFVYYLFGYRPVMLVNSQILWALALYLVATLLSGTLTHSENGLLHSLKDNLWLFSPVMFLYALNHLDWKKALWWFSVFLVLFSVYGIIQHYTGADWLRASEHRIPTPYKHPLYLFGMSEVFHAKGNFTHHLTFGGVWLLAFPLFAALAWLGTGVKRERIWWAITTVFMLLAITASLARSIWLGSLMALYVLSWGYSKKLGMLLTSAGALASVVLVMQVTYNPERLDQKESGLGLIRQRFESAFVVSQNMDRILMWKAAWRAIQDYPVFGFGLDNDVHVMPTYRKPLSAQYKHSFYNRASAGVHNIYLQTLLNYGVLGLLTYLLIWLAFFREFILTLRKSQLPPGSFSKTILWGVLAAMAGFMVAGLFENNFRDKEVFSMLMIIWGVGLYANQQCKRYTAEPTKATIKEEA